MPQDVDLVLYPKPRNMALVALGSLLFVLGAPLLWSIGSLFLRALALADVLFFGACAVFALGRLLRPRPALIIDERGITDNASAVGAGFIGWKEIAGAGISLGTSRFLVIVLHNPEVVLARPPLLKRKVMAANLGLVGSPVAIPGHMTMPLEKILEHIQAKLADQNT